MNSSNNGKFSLRSAGKMFFDIVLWALGSLMYAVGVSSFITPLKFASGGVTGLSILVNHIFPIVPVGAFAFILNIPLFIISWKKFGYKFIARTVAATAMTSFFIDFVSSLGQRYGWLYTGDDKLVGAIFGGVISGAGLGIVFMGGATTGGMDILGRLLKLKFPHISLGKLIMICDFVVILLAGIVFKSVESLLYSIIIVFLSSQAIDYVVAGRSHSKLMFIVTESPEAVTKAITSECGRGVSLLGAKGGYTGEQKQMLVCAVRAHEVPTIRKIIARFDSKPFIIITEASEVLGQGFKSPKDSF